MNWFEWKCGIIFKNSTISESCQIGVAAEATKDTISLVVDEVNSMQELYLVVVVIVRKKLEKGNRCA